MLRLLLLLLFLNTPMILLGQQEYNISVNHYNLEEGLSHNQIRWLHKDKRGMMWIGTANGINRYDGKSFKLVANLNFYSLSNRKLLEDHEGDLWLLTNHPEADLVFFNTRTERIRSFEEKFGGNAPFSKKSYTDAIMLADSTIIIKTKTNDLIAYSANQTFTKIQVGIDSITNLKSIPGSMDFWLQSHSQDTMSHTFNFFRNQLDGTFKKQATHNIRDVGDLLGISKDKEFLFWNRDEQAPTYTVLDSNGQQTIFPLPHRVTSTRIFSIVYDKKLDRFLMLLDGQLSIMQRGDTTNIYTSNTYQNLIGKQVNCELYEDEIFWIGAFRGLTEISVKSSPFKRTAYADPNSLMTQEFKSVRLLDFYIKDLNMEWPIPVKKNYSDYWTYHKDKNGRIWLGGAFGIFYLDEYDKKHKPLNTKNALIKEPTNRVLYFYKDQEGILWACANNGLFQLDPEKGLTARYANDEPNHFLPAKEMRHMYQDEAGIFWIGTFNGLLRWDKKNNQQRLFTTEDGLSNNHIMAVYEDDYGFIWMSSDNGIMQFEKSTERVKVYLPEDGITHREFNRAAHFQDSLGNLYFGSLNGITHFHPKDFAASKNEQPDIPLLLMEGTLFSGESNQLEDQIAAFQKNKKIVMRPGDRYLKLQFALLDYANPSSIQYVYNVDGETWNAGKENTLNISGLPYGKHTLTVKGRAGNGLFSKQTLNIPIEVLKPFYLQYWFLSTSVLMTLFAFYAIQKIRTHTLIRRQKDLEDTVNQRTQTIQEQAAELRRLDKAKSRFLANISHEFRTPLTLILNTLNQEELDKVINKKTKRKLNFSEVEVDVMDRNARRLSQLIEQLLDLSTLEAGKMELQESAGDIEFYLKELVQSFQTLAKEKKLKLHLEADLQNTNLNFDRDKLDKILYNLLSNAIKFTRVNGHVKINLYQDQKNTIIEIRDSGIGISKEDQVHIFDRFYQVNQTNDYTYEGTGLGLALVKELVDIHQGNIQVESTIGQGTSFRIALPLSLALPVEKEKGLVASIYKPTFDEDSETPPLLKVGEHELELQKQELPILLIIEDNKDLLYHHQKMFAGQYELILADNGILGLEKAFEYVPDLIVCDVMMPGKNGYEVCETLKLDERTDHIPIILLTAKVGQDEKLDGLKVGANEYLSKPYDQKELALRMTNLLTQQKYYQKQFQKNIEIDDTLRVEVITPDQVFVEKCKNIIEKELNNYNFGVETLSAALGMSRVNLFRKLKAITGITPSHFIRSYRLEKAKTLLLQSAGNASEVSYMVGFKEPSYFYKCFKNENGMTVGQFLESQHQNVK